MSTQMGESRTKGEKSEVQGDLQIPSSLVALALCFLGRHRETDISIYIQSPSRRDCARQKDDLRLFLCKLLLKKRLLHVCTHYTNNTRVLRHRYTVKSSFNAVWSAISSPLYGILVAIS